jgi:hypothetical protein
MTGNTDEKIFHFALGADKPLRFLHGETIFAEMHAARSLRECDIQSIIDDDARRLFAAMRSFHGALQRFSRERGAVFSREIFLTNLDAIDSGSRGNFDSLQQRRPRFCG